MNSATSPVVASLELAASEHEELLDFHVQVLLHSAVRPAMVDLSQIFGVKLERVGVTVYQACLDLDRLERVRFWTEVGDVVEDPNLVALHRVCLARARRVQGITRRRKLQVVSRKLAEARAYERARSMVVGLVGSGAVRAAEAQRADC